MYFRKFYGTSKSILNKLILLSYTTIKFCVLNFDYLFMNFFCFVETLKFTFDFDKFTRKVNHKIKCSTTKIGNMYGN